MASPSKFLAIFNARCPQCHEGRIFKNRWFQIFKFAETHENCPVCGVKYEVEPGFWFGAMYVSYAFTIGIMLVGALVIYHFFNDPPAEGYVIPIVTISLIMVPFNFRMSRVLFLHLFSGLTFRQKK